MENKKTTLIAALNWGLGHATRCIPIIKELEAAGHQVILASDGRALALLKIEFPHLIVENLPAHNIYYGKRFFVFYMILQLPKIAWITILEHFSLRKIVKQYNIEQVISDNRFGCFHPKVKSIFITHQLNILIPNVFLQLIVRWINKTWIKLFFKECWIPDVAESPNLSGVLSHGFSFPNLRYIGLLSRMKKISVPKKYDWVAVLSGPEPQRTYLEEILIHQASKKRASFSAAIVGGKSETKEAYTIGTQIDYYSFLPSETLNQLICSAEVVICRSGYSTLMDLAKTGSKAVLIPTPKQSEQEYLAQHFIKQGIFFSQKQSIFDLEKSLLEVKNYSGFEADWAIPFSLSSISF